MRAKFFFAIVIVFLVVALVACGPAPAEKVSRLEVKVGDTFRYYDPLYGERVFTVNRISPPALTGTLPPFKIRPTASGGTLWGVFDDDGQFLWLTVEGETLVVETPDNSLSR